MGQATVEAAFALPVLLLLVLLLLQPAIILYDSIVMQNAATEGCRLVMTASSPRTIEEDYVRRRLSAVPQADIFHVHGSACSWNIAFDGNENAQQVRTTIATELKPLPLIKAGMDLLGATNENGNIIVKVTAEMQTHDGWVVSSSHGISPSEWGL